MVTLEETTKETAAALAALGNAAVVSLHPRAGEFYADLVGSLAEAVADTSADTDEIRRILRTVIGRIIVTPDDATGYDIVASGNLAAFLSGEPGRTFMVGAGARTYHNSREMIPFRAAC